MLDQSFSAENFRKILDYENRKGVYLEGKYFPEIANLTEKIKNCNSEVREKQKVLGREAFNEFRKKTNQKKDELKKQKEEKLTIEIEKLSAKVSDMNFKLELKKNDLIGEKPVYTVDKLPETYFALKQIQYNFRKLYKVKQTNRFEIVNQVKCLLEDCFPKVIIRTDIKDFYETIPHEILLQKLTSENLLSVISRKIIWKILTEYRTKSGNSKGVPRGIGISAYLVELYMRNIDNEIKALPNVTYYARYVDDIIIIFTPSSSSENRDYKAEVEKIVEDKYGLKLNKDKTSTMDLSKKRETYCLDYLGYKITFGKNPINVRLTEKKVNKYKKRLDLTFNSYCNYSRVNEKKARKLLIKRLKFLTGNTRLLNNKRNILVGIYFSNSLLTDISDLIVLDQCLNNKKEALINSLHLKSRLNNMICKDMLTFKAGFEQKRFTPFSTMELSKITEAWENDD